MLVVLPESNPLRRKCVIAFTHIPTLGVNRAMQRVQAWAKDVGGRIELVVEGAFDAWGVGARVPDLTAKAGTVLQSLLAESFAATRDYALQRNSFVGYMSSRVSNEFRDSKNPLPFCSRVYLCKPQRARLPLARINEALGMLAELTVEEPGMKEAQPPAGIKDVKRKKKKSGKLTGKQMRIHRIRGDGRCMFRALAQGRSLATGKGGLSPFKEEREADELRMAVYHALCKTKEGKQLPAAKDAVMAITLEESLPRYCDRVQKPAFWGGEAELLVLAQLLKTTIIVYIPAKGGERGMNWGTYRSIQTYGAEYSSKRKVKEGEKSPPQPVHLCFNGYNHYDLLLERKS